MMFKLLLVETVTVEITMKSWHPTDYLKANFIIMSEWS